MLEVIVEVIVTPGYKELWMIHVRKVKKLLNQYYADHSIRYENQINHTILELEEDIKRCARDGNGSTFNRWKDLKYGKLIVDNTHVRRKILSIINKAGYSYTTYTGGEGAGIHICW